MVTQGDRQDYKWRPNDNSSTTRMRYDLEAEHWTRAFKSAEMKHRAVSPIESTEVIGILLKLVISLLVLVVLCLLDFFKWLKIQIK